MYNQCIICLNTIKITEKKPGFLWNYYRDESNSGYNNNNRDKIHYSIKDSKSFNYKTSITEKLEDNEEELENIKTAIPVKHLSNFLRELRNPLVGCEVSLDLKWNKNCVLKSKATRNGLPADTANNLPVVAAINSPTAAEFLAADCKLYVAVVTLSDENENKSHEQLKIGFLLTVHWNRYRCQIFNQAANNSLNYLIDPAFDKVHKLFVLAFENEEDRSYFLGYYTPTVETKDYNVLTDQKPFFKIPIKNKEETYEAITELIRNNDCTAGNLLDYEYFLTYYKLIAIDLSKQDVDLNKQQMNFIARLE